MAKYFERSQPAYSPFYIYVPPPPVPCSPLFLTKELNFSHCSFTLVFSLRTKEKVLKEKKQIAFAFHSLVTGPCFLSLQNRSGHAFKNKYLKFIFIYNIGKRIILFIIAVALTEKSRTKGCRPIVSLNSVHNYWVTVVSLDIQMSRNSNLD